MMAVSNASADLHSQNTLVRFENELPNHIDVTGYKIALQSLHLDNKYGNIPNGVLGTRNHFLLFFTNPTKDSTPNAVCDITDFSMSPQTFVNLLNQTLGKPVKGRIRVTETAKGILVTLSKCILLVHPEMNKCLKYDGTNFTYLNKQYIMLSSLSGVRNYSSGKDFPRQPAAPQIIKVQLQEMCCNLSDVALVQDLAVIQVKAGATHPFYNVCKRKEYFNLNSCTLNSLSVRLVDENNYPIHLNSGQPTFLKLQLKKFPMKSFVLRLSSYESKDVFTDNKSSNFRIALQQQLDCCGWDVALSSIFLPSKTDLKSQLTSQNFYIELPNDTLSKQRISLHALRDLTTEEFARHLTTKLAAAFPGLGGNSPFSASVEEGVLFFQSTIDIQLHISGMLAYLLKKAVTPTQEASWLLELRVGEKKRMGTLNFEKLQPHTVLIYCNFIAPLVVGNTFARVLQMIPYYNGKEEENGTMKYEAQHLDFVPLSMNDRNMLEFEMRNSSGDIVTFQDEDKEILITLVFRENK